ncbi:cadherin-like domain-containing protein [Verrucomicrobiota bacterium]
MIKKIFMALFFASISVSVYADVSLHGLFSDGAILQRNTQVPVWGTASSLESVSVSFAGQVTNTIADTNGYWRVDLNPMTANATGRVMTVTGSTNVVTVTNVLVGEVWVFSGQSNMGHRGSTNETWVNSMTIRPDPISMPQARTIIIGHVEVATPYDVLNPNPNLTVIGTWEECIYGEGTTVPMHFPRALSKNLNDIPVGGIQFGKGNRNIGSFIPEAEFLARPALFERYQTLTNNLADERAEVEATGDPDAVEAMRYGWPGILYAGGIENIIPYAINGVCWWQGENNTGDIGFYHILQEAMVDGWRTRWNRDFAFIYTQIETIPPAFGFPQDMEIGLQFDDSSSPKLAFVDTQRRYMALDTNSAMICAVDLGDQIHPSTKPDIAARHVLAAMGHVYNMPVEYSGPAITNVVQDQGYMRLYFDHADGMKGTKGMNLTVEEGADDYTLGQDGVIIKRYQTKNETFLIIQDDPTALPRGFFIVDTNGVFHEPIIEMSNNVVSLEIPGGMWVDAVAGGGTMKQDYEPYLPNIYNASNLPIVAFIETNFVYVPPLQAPPVAKPDSYTTSENISLVVPDSGFLSNDWDVNGDFFSADLIQNVTNGTLLFSTNGGFTYTPSNNFVGMDTFTYRCFDGAYGNTTTVSIAVTENIPPVSSNDAYIVNHDTLLNIDVPGVLGNDWDADAGSILRSYVFDDTTNAVLNLDTNGSFTYMPSNGYVGVDSFTYRAYDGTDYGNTVTAQVTVLPDLPPTANDDSFQVMLVASRDIPVSQGVLINDTDPNLDTLFAEKVTDPGKGVVTLNPDGSFTYTSSEEFPHTDSFTYRVYDGGLYSAPATVYLDVLAFESQQFKIQRGEFSLDSENSLTLVNGVDYTLSTNTTISNAFIRTVNSHNSSEGINGTKTLSTFVWVDNPTNILTSVDFRRSYANHGARVSWEIIEYVGLPGGPDEIIVRDQVNLELPARQLVNTGAVVNSIFDTNRVIVFITGQSEKRDNMPECARNTAVLNADKQPVFTKIVDVSGGNLSYAVVEFTGINWSDVQRVEHAMVALDTDETEPITAVNTNRAFMHVQGRTDSKHVQGAQVWLNSTNVTFRRDDAGLAGLTLVAWVVENSETNSSGAMKVQHIRNERAQGAGPEPDIWTQSVSTVSSTDNSSIMGQTANTPYNYMQTYPNFSLTAADEVSIYRRNTNGTTYYTFSVVEWPQFPTPMVPEIRVFWSGVEIQEGDNTPSLSDGTDFGELIFSDAPVTNIFSITNSGVADLLLTNNPAVTISGDTNFFTLVSDAADTNIAVGESTVFAIEYDPSIAGFRTGLVSIANNDPNDNPYRFAIQGSSVNAAAVNNSAVTDIKTSQVTLNGVLVAGVEADIYVYWGTTPGGTDPAAWGNTGVVSSVVEGPFSYLPAGLNPGTTYHYIYYATNIAGVNWSSSDSFTTLPMTRDFVVHSGTFTMASNGPTMVTLTNGYQYTLSTNSTMSNAFIRTVNSHNSAEGIGTADTRNTLVWIENPENLLTSVDIKRLSSAKGGVDVSWEIIEYVGESGGANELIVRDQGYLFRSAGQLTVTGAVCSSISDTNRVMVFVTGQSENKKNVPEAARNTAELNSAKQPVFTSRINSNGSRLSYAIVEFTGANWSDVQRVEHAMIAQAVEETEPVTTVNTNSAFMHVQGRTSRKDRQGAQVWLNSTNVTFFCNDVDPTNLILTVWIVENFETDPSAAMKVQHIRNTRAAGGSAPETWTEPISAVTAMDNSSIMGQTANTPAGKQTYPNFRLTALDEVSIYRRNTEGITYYAFSVVEWPKAVGGGDGPADSDGDGMPDIWEALYGLNSTSNDASADADGDGLSNLNEYYAGTAPDDTNSIFKIIKHSGHDANEFGSLIQALSSDAEIKLMWLGGTNGSTNDYIIYRSTSLVDGAWGQATNYPRTNASGTNVWVDTEVSNDWLNIFYKITAPTD